MCTDGILMTVCVDSVLECELTSLLRKLYQEAALFGLFGRDFFFFNF